jgi:hypothetical protein
MEDIFHRLDGLNFGRHLIKHKLKCVLFSAISASKTQVLGMRKNLLSVIVGPIISLGKLSNGIVLTRFKQCSRILLACIFIAVTADSANENPGLVTVPILQSAYFIVFMICGQLKTFPIDNFNVLGTVKNCFLVFETLLLVKAKWIDDEGVKSSP